MQAENQESSLSQVVYLIGFSPKVEVSTKDAVKSQLPILENISVGDVDAWYVLIDRDVLEGPAAESNLADIEWLTPRVIAHQTAVETLTKQLPFYPASFATLFLSLESLQELVETNIELLTQFFGDTQGKHELGLKCIVSWDEAVARYNTTHNVSENIPTGGGSNYLRQQKMIRDRDQRVKAWIQSGISTVLEQFDSLAEKTQFRRVSADVKSKNQECFANLAILVSDVGYEAIRNLVDSCNCEADNAAYLKLELTGPWPLYSFCPALCEIDKSKLAA